MTQGWSKCDTEVDGEKNGGLCNGVEVGEKDTLTSFFHYEILHKLLDTSYNNVIKTSQ